MISSGINLVMTVIGFAVSTLFIVFVCTRLICARIHLNSSRRSFARSSGSDLNILERGLHGLEPPVVANFPTKKYKELCLSSKENAQCTVCLSEYHEEDTLRILPPCGHSFHATCIDIWLQQHSTCPVCRISLRELPERKWFMQPMFSSAVRSHQYIVQSANAHYCHCMASAHRLPSGSHDNNNNNNNNLVTGPTHEGDTANVIGDGNPPSAVYHDRMLFKDSVNRKVGSPSTR